MIGADTFVVDAIIHPYDLAPANQDPDSGEILEAVYAAHKLACDPERPEFCLSHDEFFSDFSWEACVDGLKLYPAFFYDGVGPGWRLDGEDFATPLIDRVEMGLLDGIEISPAGGGVTITLCLTDPGCVHFHALRNYISDVLSDLEGVTSVHVEQALDKLWTPDRSAAHAA